MVTKVLLVFHVVLADIKKICNVILEFMERLTRKVNKSKNVVERGTGNRFERFAYIPGDAFAPDVAEQAVSVSVPQPVVQGPFGLTSGDSQLLQNILARDSSLKNSVQSLMNTSKAPGTMSNYNCLTVKFQKFCEKNSYSYPCFSEQAALHFVISLDNDQVSYAIICQIRPALALVEKLAGHSQSALTKTVDTFIEAAKRKAASDREPAVKAGTLPSDILDLLYSRFVAPFEEEGAGFDPVKLRTIVRLTVVYHTFCRFSCFNKLRATDFEDMGDSIRVRFGSAKNDQMHNGSECFIVQSQSGFDAVQLIRFYFEKFGLKFGAAQKDLSFVNCIVRKLKGDSWRADGVKAVSYSHSTKLLRELLTEAGIDSTKVSDKSFKMLGVTKAFENGMSLEELMHHGRWRTLTMPLHYKVNSETYKKDVASRIV